MAGPGITIVGLGPGAADQLTVEAQSVLSQSTEVYLRTLRHPTVASLPPHLALMSFDEIYEREASFAAVYESIARQVVELGARPQGVIFAVPGHPLVGETSVQLVLTRARAAGVPVRVVAGLSFLEPALTALGLDPLTGGLTVLDATVLTPGEPFAPAPPLEVTRPLILVQVYGARVASQAKLALMESYPASHEVVLVRAAGVPGHETTTRLPLYRLDRVDDLDPLTCLYVPSLSPEADVATLPGFQRVVARLRAPGGCPWDREQTHSTLKRHLLEESYEVLAALDSGDPAKLCEELGDLLLQIVLHAQIAMEDDEFTLPEVIKGISDKLIRRHPHVFGNTRVADTGELLRNWERIKQDERDQNHDHESEQRSMLAGVPPTLPALAASQAIQERSARVGFDWTDLAGVIEHMSEEIGELGGAADQEHRLDEFGDLLFAAANAGRWLGLDAEEALRLANRRFQTRFQAMERLCSTRGLVFAELSLDQKNALWDEVKLAERE